MKINLFLSALFAVMVSVTSGAEIVITGNDTMQFDLKAFEVKAGEKVSLTLKNTGKLPKIAMGHNLVLLKKEFLQLHLGKRLWVQEQMRPIPTRFCQGGCNCQHQTPRSGRIRHGKFYRPC